MTLKVGPRNGIYNKPFKLFTTYLVVTFLLYLIGPVKYYNVNNWILLAFLTAFLISAFVFYNQGALAKARYPRSRICFNSIQIVKMSLVYTTILYIALITQNSRVYGISLSSIFDNSFYQTMASTYTDIQVITSFSLWLLSYTGWIKIIALVGGIFYYKKIGTKYHWLLYAIIFEIVVNVMLFSGQQKQLVDLLIYTVVAFVSKFRHEGLKINKRKKAVIVLFIIAMTIVMGNVISARHSLWSSTYNVSDTIAGGEIDKSNLLFILLPKPLNRSLYYMIFYISHGYRGLSLCLKMPFEWSRGMGSSFRIMDDISRWFDIPLNQLENSYPVRMSARYGIDAYSYWHTIFPWFASDFTWLGSIIIVSMFIYYWAKAWRELMDYASLPALLLFSHLTILVMYIPCNNQLFQTRESIVATIVIFLIWYIFHGKPIQGKIV